MKVGEVGEAEATVGRWWSAWQDKDLDAIMRLALPEYVEFTGHSAEHRVGRNTLVAVARRAFAAFTIRSWNVSWTAVQRFDEWLWLRTPGSRRWNDQTRQRR